MRTQTISQTLQACIQDWIERIELFSDQKIEQTIDLKVKFYLDLFQKSLNRFTQKENLEDFSKKIEFIFFH